jgi:hypothetical protein
MLAEGLAIFAEELRLRRLQRPRKLCALCFAGIDLIAYPRKARSARSEFLENVSIRTVRLTRNSPAVHSCRRRNRRRSAVREMLWQVDARQNLRTVSSRPRGTGTLLTRREKPIREILLDRIGHLVAPAWARFRPCSRSAPTVLLAPPAHARLYYRADSKSAR